MGVTILLLVISKLPENSCVLNKKNNILTLKRVSGQYQFIKITDHI